MQRRYEEEIMELEKEISDLKKQVDSRDRAIHELRQEMSIRDSAESSAPLRSDIPNELVSNWKVMERLLAMGT